MATETIGQGTSAPFPDFLPEPETDSSNKPANHGIGRGVVGGLLAVALTATTASLLYNKFSNSDPTQRGDQSASGAGRNAGGAAAGVGGAPKVYDGSADITCDSIVVTQSGTSITIKPKVTVHSGNPDPSKFATVFDLVQQDGSGKVAERTTGAEGDFIGVPLTVEGVPEKFDPMKQLGLVAIVQYPNGPPPPGTSQDFLFNNTKYHSVSFACGNAIVALSMPGGTTTG